MFSNISANGTTVRYTIDGAQQSTHMIKLGAMLLRSCVEKIPEGTSKMCFSEDRYVYVVDLGTHPLWILLASAPQSILNKDPDRHGNITFAFESRFAVFDYGFNRDGKVDALLLKIEHNEEAIFKVDFDDGKDVTTTYYIIKDKKIYTVSSFDEVPFVAQIAGLGNAIMSNIYSKFSGEIEESEAFEEFDF